MKTRTIKYLKRRLENCTIHQSTQRVRYSEISPPGKVKYLYSEHWKTVIKETKQDANEKPFHVCETKDLKVIISVRPKVIYRLNAIPVKITMAAFRKIRKTF